MKKFYVSESVTEGHPDKVCDLISDAILDACLEQDGLSRVACEVCCSTGFVLVTGEISTQASLDISSIVRKTINEIGYANLDLGFDGSTCAVFVNLDQQSQDIAMGVDKSVESRVNNLDDHISLLGAGDQGLMFGYACDETDEFMPAALHYAHILNKKTDIHTEKQYLTLFVARWKSAGKRGISRRSA